MIRLMGIVVVLASAGCSAPDESNDDKSAGSAPVGVPQGAGAGNNASTNAAATAGSAMVSRFVTNKLDQCRLIEKNEEEGGYYRHHCPGVGGFSYELVESDLRQSLVIIAPGGRRDDVSLTSATGSGGFSTIGETFDWRGLAGAPPRSLTVRFRVNEDPEAIVPARSYLVVIGLAAPACPIGVVPPGPGQNDTARAIADRDPLPACVAGQ